MPKQDAKPNPMPSLKASIWNPAPVDTMESAKQTDRQTDDNKTNGAKMAEMPPYATPPYAWRLNLTTERNGHPSGANGSKKHHCPHTNCPTALDNPLQLRAHIASCPFANLPGRPVDLRQYWVKQVQEADRAMILQNRALHAAAAEAKVQKQKEALEEPEAQKAVQAEKQKEPLEKPEAQKTVQAEKQTEPLEKPEAQKTVQAEEQPQGSEFVSSGKTPQANGGGVAEKPLFHDEKHEWNIKDLVKTLERFHINYAMPEQDVGPRQSSVQSHLSAGAVPKKEEPKRQDRTKATDAEHSKADTHTQSKHAQEALAQKLTEANPFAKERKLADKVRIANHARQMEEIKLDEQKLAQAGLARRLTAATRAAQRAKHAESARLAEETRAARKETRQAALALQAEGKPVAVAGQAGRAVDKKGRTAEDARKAAEDKAIAELIEAVRNKQFKNVKETKVKDQAANQPAQQNASLAGASKIARSEKPSAEQNLAKTPSGKVLRSGRVVFDATELARHANSALHPIPEEEEEEARPAAKWEPSKEHDFVKAQEGIISLIAKSRQQRGVSEPMPIKPTQGLVKAASEKPTTAAPQKAPVGPQAGPRAPVGLQAGPKAGPQAATAPPAMAQVDQAALLKQIAEICARREEAALLRAQQAAAAADEAKPATEVAADDHDDVDGYASDSSDLIEL